MVKLLNFKKGLLWCYYRFECPYCGDEKYYPLWWVKLRLIFTNNLLITCDNCHSTSDWISLFRLVHDSTSKVEKEYNVKKWDSRYGDEYKRS